MHFPSSSNGLEKRPKLRFPGFDEPWMESSFDDVGSFYNGLSGKSKDDFGQGSDRFITYMNVYKNTIANPDGCELVLVENGEHQNRVEYGDILFTQSSETLEEVGLSSVWLHKASPFLNSFCFGFHFKEKGIINPRFIAYGLRTSYMREQIIREGQGATRYNLSSNRLKPIKLVYPSYQEQSKVASLMSCIEKRIEKQQELICTLKKYKRGVVRSLLSPENCKLKDAQWSRDTIGNLGSFIKGAPLSKADISTTGTPFILYGELYTTYYEVITSVVRTTDAEVDSVYRSIVGDVLIPTSGETPEEISTASCVMLPGVILAGDLNIFRSSKVDGRIMSYILNHIVNGCIVVLQGKSIAHRQASEISKIEISYPDPETQDRIVRVLEAISSRVEYCEKELDNLTKMRGSLLQQLFI